MAISSTLTISEQFGHALRARSPKDLTIALFGAVARVTAPAWWSRSAPWHIGRAVERLRLPVRLDGCTFVVPPNANATSLRGLLWLGSYEVAERFAVLKWVNPAIPVIEVGAAIGVVSCLTSKHLANPRMHVCIEANPEVIPVLKENRETNGCEFEIVHGALAYGSAAVSFGVCDSIVNSSLGGDSDRQVLVPAVHLGEMMRARGFSECSLICDIEGAEESLVRNEPDVLKDSVRTIIMEVHPNRIGPDAVDRLRQTLAELGFVLRWKRGDVWVLQRHLRSAIA